MATKITPREVEVSDLHAIMGTTTGRNVIRRILQHTGYLSDVYDVDPIKHAYKAGTRGVGVFLANELRIASPENFARLIQEIIEND